MSTARERDFSVPGASERFLRGSDAWLLDGAMQHIGGGGGSPLATLSDGRWPISPNALLDFGAVVAPPQN